MMTYLVHSLDVTDLDSIKNAHSEIADKFTSIDFLINNVGSDDDYVNTTLLLGLMMEHYDAITCHWLTGGDSHAEPPHRPTTEVKAVREPPTALLHEATITRGSPLVNPFLITIM